MQVGSRKKELCAAFGFEGLFPFDNGLCPLPAGQRVDEAIYRANLAMMRDCDGAILNLTPFRGVSADAGTIFELGLLVGLGKPAFGYTNDAADLRERVCQYFGGQPVAAGSEWCDSAGMIIEDFANADNLMIDMALVLSGARIVRVAVHPEQRWKDLTGFIACLELAAAHFGTRPAAGLDIIS